MRIIFFDDQAATDELIVSNKGKVFETVKDQSAETEHGKVQINGGAGLKLRFSNFFNLDLGAQGAKENSNNSSEEKQTVVKNALLSDYKNLLAKKRSNIKGTRKFRDANVRWVSGSLAHYQSLTPLLKMINQEYSDQKIDSEINVQKIEDTIKNSKGYYELLIESEDEKQAIVRLNNMSFWNNYKLMDILDMKLQVVAQYVGEKNIQDLDFQKNIENQTTAKPFSISKAISGVSDDKEDESVSEQMTILPMYDAVLIGRDVL